MSKYTSVVKFKIDFEGDVIHVGMRRLKRADCLKMMPFIKTAEGQSGEEAAEAMSMEDRLEFMAFASGLIPKYMVSFEGLQDEDGQKLSYEDIVEENYFMDIHTILVAKLFDTGKIKTKPKKGSKKLSPADDEAQAIKN